MKLVLWLTIITSKTNNLTSVKNINVLEKHRQNVTWWFLTLCTSAFGFWGR
jgi:hypothetical protein